MIQVSITRLAYAGVRLRMVPSVAFRSLFPSHSRRPTFRFLS